MLIEGIVLKKNIYQDRHLMTTLLLRNGVKKDVLFYGGRGGGKKNKPSTIEIGYLVQTELKTQVKTILSSSDWKALWMHQNVRKNYQSLYLVTFFCELINMSAMYGEIEEQQDLSYFNLLSNALVTIDKYKELNEQVIDQFLSLFLARMIFHQGIYPDLTRCILCAKGITNNQVLFNIHEGGFCCISCTDIPKSDYAFYLFFNEVKIKNFKELESLSSMSRLQLKKVLEYFCFHCNFTLNQIKTLPFLFK